MSELSQDPVTTSSLETADELVSSYLITDDDLKNIHIYGEMVIPRLDEYIDHFYVWLRTQPDFNQFFSSPEKLAIVQKQQVEYWTELFRANVDEQYIEKRREVGEAHARIGLPLHSYFKAVNVSRTIFLEQMYDGSLKEDKYIAVTLAISKLIQLDSSIVIDTISNLTNRKIFEQSQSLLEMSTPVMILWEEILLLPIVGTVDSKRAQTIMQTILEKVAETESRVVIVDILGVPMVDSAVAAHLLKIARASKLLGCKCILSGLSPRIAETLVHLGIELGDIDSTSTVSSALALAFDVREVEVKAKAAGLKRKQT